MLKATVATGSTSAVPVLEASSGGVSMLKVPFPLVGGYGLASLSAFKWADASHLAHHDDASADADDVKKHYGWKDISSKIERIFHLKYMYFFWKYLFWQKYFF